MNFNYFFTERVFDYVLDSVDLVATHGWRLLPRYCFDPPTGMWRHVDGQPEPPLSLRDVRYEGGEMIFEGHRHRAPESALDRYLEEGRAILAEAPLPVVSPSVEVSEDFEYLRWFWLPEEVGAR